jgi:hypothetical protein
VRTARFTTLTFTVLALSGWSALRAVPARAQAPAEAAPAQNSPAPTSPAASPPVQTPDQIADSAILLFAHVEEAWGKASADRLAELVDTTVVRIALKPGSPPTSAVTRNAAAFLFQDQLRLVSTVSFRIVQVEISKKGKARATAEWTGDWGGRQGTRDVKVDLAAAISGNRWLLTEVRAND